MLAFVISHDVIALPSLNFIKRSDTTREVTEWYLADCRIGIAIIFTLEIPTVACLIWVTFRGRQA